ncbi:GNAT family N-acetyltransferase [Oenococcus kitaharae]|uniref:Spermidine N1-acetyltransferase n=1 Tax=Oenococcus kitaharae DSM 17330 TaxID=1045004 RepID=G9WGG8_9LACO|nr:GNAT family N-acetyltransferase [Oenococcus kitaharae]EHN59795.1 Spermidine N1-acetyltransferase [Oenococcus kitaharae DSM 17330]MCV3295548.1 GNAT family N-acetyltransferase [Oenococcus kitaharae]OEY83614.1 spermidine acetyltransferase [Oenococcus kitaharae]OEY85412.1 spermidine acetyltransferase [Oenococcus kitaharae]OEY86265.1 spermidine acetyltransferase [Oenococcus kitaharae]
MVTKLRPLERKDLGFIHQLDNERATMAFWFEEPYESLDELTTLYDKHIHDERERRFVVDVDDEFAGILELVDIDFLHRTTEIQIIIDRSFRGRGLATVAMRKGLDYAFNMINMFKVYLFVDVDNARGLHVYKKLGFVEEGRLRKHFFANGQYHDSFIMGIFKQEIKD